jgi:hypothetical protein
MKREQKPLTPIERRGEFAKAVRIHKTTVAAALREFGISGYHFYQVMDNQRKPSRQLAEKICQFTGHSLLHFWGMSTFNTPNPYSSSIDESDDNRL